MTEHRLTKLESDTEYNTRAINDLVVQVTELNESLAKYRGAWGMLVMIGGAVVGGVTIWLQYLRD